MLNILFKRLTQRAAENDEDAIDDGGYKEERLPACPVNKSQFPTPPQLPIVCSLTGSNSGCDQNTVLLRWGTLVKIQLYFLEMFHPWNHELANVKIRNVRDVQIRQDIAGEPIIIMSANAWAPIQPTYT